jgi:ribosomal protein L23
MGKLKRTMTGVGKRAGYKKAYVTLAEGSKIDLVEGL